MVNKLVMPKAEKAKFASALNDVEESINNNGFMTSDAYKAIEKRKKTTITCIILKPVHF